MLKFSGFFFLKLKENCEAKCWIFGIILFVEMKISKLINYLTEVCQSHQGTTVSGG